MVRTQTGTAPARPRERKSISVLEIERRANILMGYIHKNKVADPVKYYSDLKKILLRGRTPVVLALLLLTQAAYGSETKGVDRPVHTRAEIRQIIGESLKVERVVHVKAEMSTDDSVFDSWEDLVPYGTTALSLLESKHKVERRMVCTHPDEVWSVDGIETDPAQNRYWYLRVNGSEQMASPHASLLENGDIVEWFFTDGRRRHAKWK